MKRTESYTISSRMRVHEQIVRPLTESMTLEEKVSQLMFGAKAIEHLGIPDYNWWNEALHGVARAGTATVFPQPIGLAATFDDDLISRIAACIADEGRAKYNAAHKRGDHGIYKGLTFWSPNINIFRDPRWGRGHETFGEDPCLTATLGTSFIKSLQGDGPYLKAAACVKHFAVHSGPESERHSFNAVVDRKDLNETYLYAFKKCIQEGDPAGLMGAYNRLNDEPCCASLLLKQLVRDLWGFEGYIVSDCWALADFHLHHKVTEDAVATAALALNSGCELNCGNILDPYLIEAVQNQLVPMDVVDSAVTRLLAIRSMLGILDARSEYDDIPVTVIGKKEYAHLAEEAAQRSLVLLKNDGILPIDPDRYATIGVIGPNADNRTALMGNYHGTSGRMVTVLQGIEQRFSTKQILFSEGCHLFLDRTEHLAQPKDRFSEALAIAEASDIVFMVAGLDTTLEGEQGDVGNSYGSGDKPDLSLPGDQLELLQAVYQTGTPTVLIVLTGSVVDLTWAEEHLPGIILAWYPGEAGGRAVASLLAGEVNPEGKLPVTWYRESSDLPDFRDYAMKGRTYRYAEIDPLYPFGYGLSYSSYQIDQLTVEPSSGCTPTPVCSVRVQNIGDRSGATTVQWYARMENRSAHRQPRWSLIGFKRVCLEPGEEQLVSLALEHQMFSWFDDEGEERIATGPYTLYVGDQQPDQRSTRLTGKIVDSVVVHCDELFSDD